MPSVSQVTGTRPSISSGSQASQRLWGWVAACLLLALIAGVWRYQPTAHASGALANGAPDLVVTSIISAQGLIGCPTTSAGLIVTIHNQGTAPADEFLTTLSGGFTSCSPWHTMTLDPGADRFFFCPAAMPGASVYTATVDVEDTVAESDETNNTLVTTVWVITLPTCTPSPTATHTPTPVPTGWLGPLTVTGYVREGITDHPLPGAVVSGYVQSMRGGGGALPVVTAQPDGAYSLPTGFGLYDTDTCHITASAVGHADDQASVGALSVYAGQSVNLTLAPLVVTPTPTATPVNFLHLTVSLQGRPPAPDPTWRIPLRIRLWNDEITLLDATEMTDTYGAVRLENLSMGTYHLMVQGPYTLSNLRENLIIGPDANLVSMGVLRTGDGNEDDLVDILDFSLFRTLFGSADPRGDFDGSGIVDIVDFSLLRLNFGLYGPIIITP